MNNSNRRIIRNLIMFVAGLIALPWVGWWLDVQAGHDPHIQDGSLGWLFFIITPLTISLLLRGFGGDGWRDMGLKPSLMNDGKYYWLAILFHPVSMSLVILLGVLLGSISVPDASLQKFSLVAQAFGSLILASLIKNIFEEFSWRGYLAPRVQNLVKSPLIGHLVVGLIWFSWHLPYYLVLMSADVLKKSTSIELPILLLLTFIGIFPTSILYGEIRRRTNSIWPLVIIHTMANVSFDALILQNFFKIPSGMTEILFSPGLFSIIVTVINATAGIILFRQAYTTFQTKRSTAHA